MDKQEFVNGLRRGLSGMEDFEYINDTISYYENYIETEVRKGQTEEAVLRMLGDPGLIAKSIKASRGEIKTTTSAETVERTDTGSGNDSRDKIYGWVQKLLSMPGWLLKAIGVVVVIMMLVLFSLLIQWLFPVIVIGGVAYVFYRFLKDNFLG